MPLMLVRTSARFVSETVLVRIQSEALKDHGGNGQVVEWEPSSTGEKDPCRLSEKRIAVQRTLLLEMGEVRPGSLVQRENSRLLTGQ